MEYNDLIGLLSSGDPSAIAGAFIPDGFQNDINYLAQYYPQLHHIHDPALRPDKQIFKPDPLDPERTIPATVKVARLSLPLQKHIVKLRSQFLLGNPVTLDCTANTADEKAMLEGVQKIWEDCKLDYKNKYISKLVFSECEAAELWFAEENNNDTWRGTTLENVIRQSPEGDTITGKVPKKFKMRILAKSLGDTLLPMFDKNGDMIAFGRFYELDDKHHLDIYTDTSIHQGTKEKHGNEWNFDTPLDHGLGKIPVIYYAQDYPEWHDVQPLIERLEVLLSNNADTNDYFGSPTAVASGNILSYADKGESGKMVQLENGAEIKYLTWDSVPENIKLEWTTLLQQIFILTGTPSLDFEAISALGRLSAFTIKMLFMPAHMEASDKEDIIGECFQRRINLLKQFVSLADQRFIPILPLSIKPKFTLFLPKDEGEIIANLAMAKQGGFLSTETSVDQMAAAGIVPDAAEEMKRITKDNEMTAAALNGQMNDSLFSNTNPAKDPSKQ
jgi:SPP1 family phage portal protein